MPKLIISRCCFAEYDKEMRRDLFITYMHSQKRGSTRRMSHCSKQPSFCRCRWDFLKLQSLSSYNKPFKLISQTYICVPVLHCLQENVHPCSAYFCQKLFIVCSNSSRFGGDTNGLKCRFKHRENVSVPTDTFKMEEGLLRNLLSVLSS